MSPKAPPVFMRPNKVDVTRLAELEAKAEARGNAVAGQPVNEQQASKQKSSKLRREESGVRVAGYLPADLEHSLRMHCAQERRSVSDALTEAVRMLLAHRDPSALK